MAEELKKIQIVESELPTLSTLEEIQSEIAQQIQEVQNNLNIFLTWARKQEYSDKYYETFSKTFPGDFRCKLFENISYFFKDETLIDDEILLYWKWFVINLLQKSKKFKSDLELLSFQFDPATNDTNLVLVKQKHMFNCFIEGEHICYFKENGTEYYIS